MRTRGPKHCAHLTGSHCCGNILELRSVCSGCDPPSIIHLKEEPGQAGPAEHLDLFMLSNFAVMDFILAPMLKLPQSTTGHGKQDFPFAQSYLSHVPAG
jgi:hypothetical protein